MFSQLFLEKHHYFRISQQTKRADRGQHIILYKATGKHKTENTKMTFSAKKRDKKDKSNEKTRMFFSKTRRQGRQIKRKDADAFSKERKTRKANQTKKRRCFF